MVAFVQCFTQQSSVNETHDVSLDDAQYLPVSEGLPDATPAIPTELDLTNTLQRCCFKKYVYRASRGKNCVDFCTGNLDLALLEQRRYVTCVEVLNDVIGCYGEQV
uniref:DB domain-containing protein n=1 Tax=Steinernema glaseri TaxID=37863 RepID=A0A1I7XZM5_9BILA